MIRLLTLSAALLCPLWVGAQTYDLRAAGEDKSTAGDKVLHEEIQRQEMAMKVFQGDQVMQEQAGQEGYERTYREHALEVDDEGEITHAKRSYTRFVDLQTQEELDGELEVELVQGADGTFSLSPLPEGRVIPALLRKQLEEAVAKKNATLEDGADDEKEPEEIFTPEEPVAVGATWTVDPAEAMEGMELDEELDVENSSCTGTLVSAVEEGGTTWLTIKIDMTLRMLTMEGVKCAEPFVFDMDLELRLADGGSVAGRFKMNGTMQGSIAPPDAPPGVQVHVDMKLSGDLTRTKQ